MSTTTAGLTRRTPPLGGFSWPFLRLELQRLLRNRRAVIFTLVLPSAFFLLFGTASDYKTQASGHGNVTAYIMVSMAVYGAMIATTSGGAMVATERALGWSRQLRLTPLRPVAYVAIKTAVAMSMAAVAIVVVMVVGQFFGADAPTWRLVLCALLGWLCSAVFAALGLFVGYLLPSENVMQVLGPVLALLSFAGGLFLPLSEMSDVFASIAKLSPAYGVGVIARWPIDTSQGNLAVAVVNVVAWLTLFAAGSAWRMSKDTQRV
jgi:ABC-2 type transport system permease protein